MFASHTRLEKADECLFAFYVQYVKKVKPPANAPAIEGAGFHAVAEQYARHCIREGVASDEEAIPGIVRRVCFDPENTHAPGAVFYPRILALAQKWASRTVLDPERIIDLEMRLPVGWDPENRAYPPANVGRHLFVGVIDRLELDGDVLVIRDYKTTRAIPTQLAVEESPQLRRYVGLVWQEYPQFSRYRVELEFVRYGEIRFAEFGADVGRATLEEIEAQLDQLEHRINKVRQDEELAEKLFPATPGAHCSYCPFSHLCPEVERDSSGRVIRDEETAKDVVGQLLALRRRVEELQAAVRAYTQDRDPVTVGGVAVGYHEQTSVGFHDAKAFYEACIRADENPWLYLSVDNRKAKRLIERDEFRGLVSERTSVRFDTKKIREEDGDHEDSTASVSQLA